MTTKFYEEIFQQPTALRDCVRAFQPIPSASYRRILMTGMGASLNAARIATLYAQSLGLPVFALEAGDLLNYSSPILDSESCLVFVSQSGKSAEIAPILDLLPAGISLIGVTNDPQSLLAQRASTVLLLHAGAEATVATKTYLNTLATLWLLVRSWSNRLDGSETETLLRIADRIEAQLAQAHHVSQRWIDTLGQSRTLLFLGHGAHAVTATQAAMMVNEWAKVPATGISVAACRHGTIESVDTNTGVVIFAPPGKTQASALAVARELEGYGAPVLVVVNGESAQFTSDLQELPAGIPDMDEFLSPLLDVIPAQLFAEAFARQRGIEPGFRHIAKVVTRL